MLTRPAQLAIFVAVLFVSRTANAQMKLYSYAFKKQYVSTVTWEQISAAPAWKQDEENPPVSARKAIRLATKVKDSLVKDDEHFGWRMRSVELHEWGGDYWYWVATYEAILQGGRASSGQPSQIRLIVLMDGTAVKPAVNPWPPKEDDDRPAEKSANSK